MSSQANRQIKQIVGDNIRLARDERNWSQARLGFAIGGAHTSEISRWEKGHVRPNDDKLALIASKLGHDFAWFFVDRDQSNGEPDPAPLGEAA